MNSTPRRPRLSQTAPSTSSIFSGGQSGKAAWRLERPIRCSGNHGPIRRKNLPARSTVRSAFRRRTVLSTANAAPSSAAFAARRAYCRAAALSVAGIAASEIHDDFAENLAAFQTGEAALELGKRNLGIDYRQ